MMVHFGLPKIYFVLQNTRDINGHNKFENLPYGVIFIQGSHSEPCFQCMKIVNGLGRSPIPESATAVFETRVCALQVYLVLRLSYLHQD